MPGQDVEHDTCRMDVVGQGLGTGGINGVQAVGEHGGEDTDHLPITTRRAFELALNTADRHRQVPSLEGCPVAQRTGLAGQNGYVMQWIVDGVVAPEGPHMATDNLTVLPAFQTVGISPDLHRSPKGAGINRVSVLVEPYEAGLGQ